MCFFSAFKRILILIAVCGLMTACKLELYTQLDEREAVEMIGLLQSKGIYASKIPGKEGKWKLVVDERDVSPAIQIFQASGYPKNQHISIGDTFKGEGIVPSKFAERARYLHATTEELAATLERIDGVYSARVHLVSSLNEESAENSPPSVASASVFLKCRPELADETSGISLPVEEVKKLIANGVPGLTTTRVSVSVFPTTPLDTPLAIEKVHKNENFWNRLIYFSVAAVLLTGLYFAWEWRRKQAMEIGNEEVK